MNSGYSYPDSQYAEDLFLNKLNKPAHNYSRFANPTMDMFQDRMALLEGAEAARAFATGMSAVTNAVMSQVRAGAAERIKQLSAPPEVTHRLREMGFCEEQKIKLLSHQTKLICQVCNVRLGISITF